ncbi:unnamed protein product [Caenorhabditis sp. 36 PRJEB53466]|nr:unnamed protein product [Caenorhabditis sp. 36 PRJEB53466]
MGFDTSDVADNISRICYMLTVFFNSSLIYLTVYCTKQIVGTYRNMIVTFATFGISFSSLDILVRPLFHSFNGCFLFFTLGSSFRSSKVAAEYALLAYASAYAVVLAFLTVQFMYRACVLARPQWTKHFDGWKLILWIGYALLFGLLWFSASIIVYPDEISYNYVRNEMMRSYRVEIKNVPCFLVLAFNEENNRKEIRWNSVFTIGTVTGIISVQYAIMLFCGIIMYRRTKGKLTNASTCYERLQKQMFVALIYQVSAPSLIFHLPGMFVLLAPFFDFKFSFHSRIVVYGLSAYPLVDSLILLRVISEYKIAYNKQEIMALEDSIHGLKEYKAFNYYFTFSTLIAMCPFFYMIPTITVMLRICKTYMTAKNQPMDRHIFMCLALNFLFSISFFLFDYIRLSLPSTGLFTSWCAGIEPNHHFKIIFLITFFSNYCVLLLPFFLCVIRLTILLRPRDNSFVILQTIIKKKTTQIQICPKIMMVAIPLLIIIPFGCTAFMIPAVGYCRKMGPPLEFGAIYIYYSGGWSGWRNSYIHLFMSVIMCSLTIAGSVVMLLKLKKVTSAANTTSVKTKKASSRAENSLTITMIASMIPFINNTVLTIVYLTFPDYVYYLMIFRPFGNDIETVMMPWILYLTHPMFQTSERRISSVSTVSIIIPKSSAM